MIINYYYYLRMGDYIRDEQCIYFSECNLEGGKKNELCSDKLSIPPARKRLLLESVDWTSISMLISSHKWPVSFQRDLYLRDVEARLPPRIPMPPLAGWASKKILEICRPHLAAAFAFWWNFAPASRLFTKAHSYSRTLSTSITKLSRVSYPTGRAHRSCPAVDLGLGFKFVFWEVEKKCIFKVRIYALTLKYKF